MALLCDRETLGAETISTQIAAVNKDPVQDSVCYSHIEWNGETIAPGGAYVGGFTDEQLFFNSLGDVDIYIASVTLTDENGRILPEGYKHGEKAKAGLTRPFFECKI